MEVETGHGGAFCVSGSPTALSYFLFERLSLGILGTVGHDHDEHIGLLSPTEIIFRLARIQGLTLECPPCLRIICVEQESVGV